MRDYSFERIVMKVEWKKFQKFRPSFWKFIEQTDNELPAWIDEKIEGALVRRVSIAIENCRFDAIGKALIQWGKYLNEINNFLDEKSYEGKCPLCLNKIETSVWDWDFGKICFSCSLKISNKIISFPKWKRKSLNH